MKQHITKQQYDELSDKAKQKLLDWWKPQLGDIVFNGQHKPDGIDALTIGNALTLRNWQTEKLQINIDPLPTIGQMIELIGAERLNQIQTWDRNSWRICPYVSLPIKKMKAPELCDALWLVAKRLLENWSIKI